MSQYTTTSYPQQTAVTAPHTSQPSIVYPQQGQVSAYAQYPVPQVPYPPGTFPPQAQMPIASPLPQPLVNLAPKTATSIKLFVGQIPRQMTESELLPIFQQYGTVCEVHVLRDRATSVSRGCGFVVMSQKEEADAAIAALDKQKILPPVCLVCIHVLMS